LLKAMHSIWSSVSVPADDPMAVVVALQGMTPLREWAIDLDRRLNEIEQALDEAQSLGLPKGLPSAENALWRLSAGRKSLQALCCLTLGVATMEPGDIYLNGRPIKDKVKKSVQWNLDGKKLGKKLAEVGGTYPIAAELNALLVDLAEHPAVTLRDEISHSLAPIGGAPTLCLFELWGVEGDALIRPHELKYLWPRRMGEKPGITREELWPHALSAIKDAYGILIDAVGKLSGLIQLTGLHRESQRVYVRVDTGEMTFHDPRGISSTADAKGKRPGGRGR
jgi:hypothetical protein